MVVGDEELDEPTEEPEGHPESSDATDPGRRKFLIRGISVIGGGITAAIALPAVAYVTGSSRAATGEEEWVRLGSVSSIEPGVPPALVKATVERRTGYLTEEQEISVFVTTETGAEFTILSNICTHLGCRVRWVQDQNGYFCPCHNAIFGPDGEVVQGPPPRPLDRFEYMIEEGQLFIKET
jgi:Rieske Fe-S protein